jgi:hypothetical protein
MRRERAVLVVQHAFSALGSEAAGAEAFRLRTSLAFSTQGVPLGILEAAILGGDMDTQDDGWAAIREAQQCCPKSRIVAIGDCEGDLPVVFEEALQQNCPALVRAKGNAPQLRPCLQGLPEAGEAAVPVALQGSARSARSARLSVRFAPLPAKPNLPLWAVWARETVAPVGVAPIDWMLVTTVPVDTVGDAFECVAWYARRGGVEVFQAILASGCRVRQLAGQRRLEACLAIDMVVAWRRHYLACSGRGTPENGDAERTLPAPGPAHRGTANPEPLHRAPGA